MESSVVEEQQLLQQEDGTFLLQQADGTYVALNEDEINQLVEQGVLQVQEVDEQLPDSTTAAIEMGIIDAAESDNSSMLAMEQQSVISSQNLLNGSFASHVQQHQSAKVSHQIEASVDTSIVLPDMEKVQHIQSQLAAVDSSAPLGSSRNPIRIIQQGNQYVVTQQLNDEQMKQIMQVLENQQLLTEAQSGPQSTVYNPETNTRIIFRMTQNSNNDSGSASNSRSNHSMAAVQRKPEVTPNTNTAFNASYYSGPVARRGRPPLKRRMEEDDPDFSPQFPDVKSGKLTSSGRVVRPPRHMIKDYKTIPLDSMDDDFREEDSDGGYSDFKVSDEENVPEIASNNSAAGNDSSQTLWECDRCTAQFATRIGLNRHVSIKHDTQRGPRNADNAFLLPLKRRNALKNALAEATDEEIVDICLPRLSKLVTPFDFLLVKSEKSEKQPMPDLATVTEDLWNLMEISRAFLQEHLIPADEEAVATEKRFTATTPPSPLNDDPIINIDSDSKAVCLGIPCGPYRIKTYINEGYLPSRHRNIQVRSDTPPPPNSMLKQQKNVEIKAAAIDACQDIVDRVIKCDSSAADESPLKFDNQMIRIMVPSCEQEAANAALFASAMDDHSSIDPCDDLIEKPAITDDDIESGRYVQVLDEEGLPSELVIQTSTSQLFNRFTGQQITVLDEEADNETENRAPDTSLTPATTAVVDADENKQRKEVLDVVNVADKLSFVSADDTQQHDTLSKGVSIAENNLLLDDDNPLSEVKEGVDAEEATTSSEEVVTIDIDKLFPGVTIQDIDADTILITKPDGSSLQVEHGGNGITLETLQSLLQMEYQ